MIIYKKTYIKIYFILLAIAFMFLINTAFAGTVTFEKEYTYQASEADSKLSSRTIALEQVKRLLLEELGTYLESETEVKNFQLTKDQITVLTAGIVRTEIANEKWDGQSYYLKAKISADPDEVIKSIDKLRKDRQKTKELEDANKKANLLLKENEQLKKELEITKEGNKSPILKKYANTIKGLSAIDWFSKGISFGLSGDAKKEIDAYTKAIEIDPQYAAAYNNRGVEYLNLGNYNQALKDFNKTIELNPEMAEAFTNRGLIYDQSGNYQNAIKDYSNAIKLEPKKALFYTNRGLSYARLGNYRQAIIDFNKAIELNPNDEKAFEGRGAAYYLSENYQQAIKDFSRAIDLNPVNAAAYYNRGLAYGPLGNEKQKLNNLQSAGRLGHKEAQKILTQFGYRW